ncbi:MAG TPA: hypothetical protein VF865_20635 [Acidobacteriaceae bacterium]
MKPALVQKSRFEQKSELMMLDNAEMALELIDLTDTVATQDMRRSPSGPAAFTFDRNEFASAACLILDREEAEAIARELELILHHHPIAA